ncbi:MAG TPA: hypothetical protein VL992_02680 [Tepidisphaeraceae bacterium]|nr:hypothetical protein [Tepidisphaeraceae bacterium]
MKYVCYAIGIPLLMLAVGCGPSSPYVSGYYYDPHPLVASLPTTQPSEPPPVSAYATIVGIRLPDDKLHLPLSMEVRLRIDDNSPDPVTLDPRSMDLSTGDLVRFDPAIVNPMTPVTINPGESAMITAEFPFPPGMTYSQINLEDLQWRWVLYVGPQRVDQVANFKQVVEPTYYGGPYYYGPSVYVYPPYPVIGGVVVIHHRW